MMQSEKDLLELKAGITVDPTFYHGKPCIRGLRYPVEVLQTLMTAGMPDEAILSDDPDLITADLQVVRLLFNRDPIISFKEIE